MGKQKTGVPAPPQQIMNTTYLNKTKNKNLAEFKDCSLIQLRRQHADDIGANGKPFSRRYNVGLVDEQGNTHELLDWSVNHDSATPDHIINMILQDKAQLVRNKSGKVSCSITKAQQKKLIEELKALRTPKKKK